jgi:pyruvate dehydrogenase E2 component (dihydrolipoamide acetyltransferase)
LRNATITLSNYGVLGGRYANLVVVPPQVAILGIGRARGTPPDLPLSLTIDHRAVSGGEAARFLAAFIASIESAGQE